MSHLTLAQGCCARHSITSMLHAHCVLSGYSSRLHVALFTVSLIFHLILLIFIFNFHVGWFGENTLRTLANEEPDTSVDTALLTGYEPNVIDNFHISETTEFFIQESSSDSRPLNSHDLDIDDYTIGRAPSSPLFTQEREEPAGRGQVYHSPEESLLSSQLLSVCHVRTGRPVSDQFDSVIPNVRENPCRESENEQVRILRERQKRADSR